MLRDFIIFLVTLMLAIALLVAKYKLFSLSPEDKIDLCADICYEYFDCHFACIKFISD